MDIKITGCIDFSDFDPNYFLTKVYDPKNDRNLAKSSYPALGGSQSLEFSS